MAALKVFCSITGGFLTAIGYIKAREFLNSHQKVSVNQSEEYLTKLTRRERRFLEFASTEYAGQIYMTPGDFLSSVLERKPKPCLRRKILSKEELEQCHKQVPSVQHNTSHMFRRLSDSGILSYADYLFLLSVLTRPESGFRIVFDMFDTDGSQRIEQREFLAIRQILGRTLKERKVDDDTKQILKRLTSTADCMRKANEYVDMGKVTATTLQIHFFGPKGTDALRYADFYKFMKHLQQEVLQIEFGRYSRGRNFISDEEFAYLLLSYTELKPKQYDKYLSRIQNMTMRSSVTFEEFESFCQVLHNLDDFIAAMQFFYSAKKAISKEEFAQAVRICSGSKLSDHLIELAFALFDEDSDGYISLNEFLLMMKNRLKFFSGYKPDGLNAFKRCLRMEIKK